VLVVDFQLRGGRSGIDAIAAVARAVGANRPTLIVSGASAPERLAQLQASGFEWLIKPVPAARLRSWLIEAARAAFIAGGDQAPAPVTGGPLLEPELKWTS